MPRKKQVRSEQTKQDILNAAGRLFAAKGYDAVTMREVAKEAGCSHTAIYIYFEDKEALLHELSIPALTELQLQIEEKVCGKLEPEEALRQISLDFIRFCLIHRNMHRIFFEARSVRVDEAEPELEINRVRNRMFRLLMQAVRQCLDLPEGSERLLSATRIYFYLLHGIVGTYQLSEESAEELMERLLPTFREAIEVLLLGFRAQHAPDK
ncbi:TetR/AcrR family transcriptional regulator [Paenibacillus favisporus]|uniref:TetR/AcrR family transcriptional regulator n=1 Tax=Paenibacillus favisporus TaxID=221028 RepID=UPI0013D18CD8|nr:TetR/AcrR family transcriptional regulator [Paenibacillus favisporus]